MANHTITDEHERKIECVDTIAGALFAKAMENGVTTAVTATARIHL